MSERLAFNLGGRRDVGSGPAVQATPAGAPATIAEAHPRPAVERRDWAFTWTLVFTAVLFFRPQDVYPPLGALHLAELSAIAGLISLFMGRLARRQPLSRVTPELIGVFALGAVILLTAPFSIWFGGAVHAFTDQYVKVTLVYLLAVNVLDSPKRVERLTWVLVLVLGYIAFRAVLDYARGVNMIARGTRVVGTVGGLVGNPNDLALHMVVALPLALFMAMRPDAAVLKRLTAAFCGVCMMGGVVASGSRGGFLGLVVTIIALAAFAARRRPGLVMAGVLAVMCALPVLPDQYWRRIESITDPSKDDYQSSTARRELFSEAFDAFLENPLTGVGAGQFDNYKPQERKEAWHETHNIWLQVAADLGILGVIALTFLVARAFSAVWQTRRLLARVRRAAAAARRPTATGKVIAGTPVVSADEEALLDAHSAAMASTLIGFFVCAFFASVAYNWTFYYLIILAAAPRDFLRERIPGAGRRRARVPAPAMIGGLGPREVRA